MIKRLLNIRLATTLLLMSWSAAMFFSCKEINPSPPNPETLMTQQSDSLTIVVTKNGLKQYRFIAPLMERYELAREPYMEFREGIYVETFRDTTEVIESTIVADYAIRYENRSLWETRGNVVATGDDRTLYTEQLFWDEKTQRIYSNVDSKVVQGDDVFIGEGFESDDKFKHWTFRNYTGQLAIDASSNEKADSTSTDSENKLHEDDDPSVHTDATVRTDDVREFAPDSRITVDDSDTTSVAKPAPTRLRPEAAPAPAARPTQLRRHIPNRQGQNDPNETEQSENK